jgi:hypothetical protein
MPTLSSAVRDSLGTTDGWSLAMDESDPDGQTLLYVYPTVTKIVKDQYIRPEVKIEMGARSDHWPSEQTAITPYVALQFPAAFKLASFTAKVLAPERTFWEKATLLHAEYHRPGAKTMPKRLSRHYYDLARLIEAGLGEKAIAMLKLLDRVVQHKMVFFQSSWALYGEAKKGTLRIAPSAERMEELLKDYEDMGTMFFGARPKFTEIVNTLSEWENAFNMGK